MSTIVPNTEAVTRRCSVKKKIFKISQNSHENISEKVSESLFMSNFIKKVTPT